MADLSALIRLRKHRVEEKQKALAELFREAERFEAAIQGLLDQRERERALAEEKNDYETLTAYTLFAERVKTQIDFLKEGLRRVNARVVVAQDAMREAFGELKKIEIIQENRKAEEARALQKKEGQMMDEVGLQRHARQQGETES